MMGDNKSEKFFKVLHDRMKDAQMDIKATVTVNVGEMSIKANDKEMEGGGERVEVEEMEGGGRGEGGGERL